MTMTSSRIAAAWALALESCVALNDYCQEQFGVLPAIFEGLDVSDLPGAKDAPYVIIAPFGVKGGPEAERTEIAVHVACGALYRTRPGTAGRITRITSGTRMEEEFWPLVRQALEDSGADVAPQEIEFEMDAPDDGFVELRAAITITEDTTR